MEEELDSLARGRVNEEEEEEEDEEDNGAGWEDWADEEDEVGDGGVKCLFCEAHFSSSGLVFQHCASEHSFDFLKLRRDHQLQFYDCLRLINYVRSQVARCTCWSCELISESQGGLLQHLKSANHSGYCKNDLNKRENGHNADNQLPWHDDKFLTPFLDGDSLLYSFEEDLDDDSDGEIVDKDLMSLVHDNDLESCLLTRGGVASQEGSTSGMDLADGTTDQMNSLTISSMSGSTQSNNSHTEELRVSLSISGANGAGNGHAEMNHSVENIDPVPQTEVLVDALQSVTRKRQKDKLKVTFAEVAEKERFNINQNYFGSYSTFGIHREMLSDKIRTEAYQRAISRNPSLFEGAIVMDLGCGTGILSLFAAKAGAKRVIAVEGSKKMALVAEQVAKANGCFSDSAEMNNDCGKRVIKIAQGMIEELDLSKFVNPHGFDILVSEWMGYCLLFESMLNSVIVARDRWLKPGGAILPDVAEMYVAGFGLGGTSLPFWENVYGFDMQCIGHEVLEDAATSLIVDAIESKDVVTDPCLIQAFDLMTMKEEDVDFTSSFQLNVCSGPSVEKNWGSMNGKPTAVSKAITQNSNSVWCYGLVVWFDTCFTSRFCTETPVVLSTSPHSPKTHWSQTLLTFREPVCLSCSELHSTEVPKVEEVGTAASPAFFVKGRISIARSSRHRSIDISLETSAVGACGIVRTWPVQMFDI